jgi:hypothetical protein
MSFLRRSADGVRLDGRCSCEIRAHKIRDEVVNCIR